MRAGDLKYKAKCFLELRKADDYGDTAIYYDETLFKTFRVSANLNPQSKSIVGDQLTFANDVILYTWKHDVDFGMNNAVVSVNYLGADHYYLVNKVVPLIGRTRENTAAIYATEIAYEDIKWKE